MSSNVFDKFESSLERMVEGSVGRLFKNSVQPAEIARKLERAMVANQWISVQGRLVPNHYKVQLSSVDFAVYADSVSVLNHQLAKWLLESASKRGFNTVGDLSVSIIESSSASPRSILVETHHAGVDVLPPLPPADPTEEFRLRRSESPRPSLALRLTTYGVGVIDHPIRKSLSMVGRALENDIVLDFPEVSRFHARIELSPGTATITDLGSTNGTWVNSQMIQTATVVVEHDSIAFGAVKCLLVGIAT